MKDFHPRKIVLWVHVLPLTINGSCSACWCGQLRGCAVFGFRLRVTVRRAPYASAGRVNRSRQRHACGIRYTEHTYRTRSTV